MMPLGEPRPLTTDDPTRATVAAACQSPIRAARRRGTDASATLAITDLLESFGEHQQTRHGGDETAEDADEKQPRLGPEPLVEVVAADQPAEDRARELEAERGHLDR